MTALVSVVTPTWGRHDRLLDRCIPSVLAQDHAPVEHVIVSDGPDPVLHGKILERYHDEIWNQRIVYAELDDHDPGKRWGHRARLRGIELARGDILAWLDDDNSFRPMHVSRLAALLHDEAEAGFAYSTILFHGPGGEWPVGADPPCLGGIDTSAIAHRRDLLETATWRDDGQQTIDWDLVERWMGAGIKWGYDPVVTADYYQAGF